MQCQSKGVKVILSMGGAVGNYGFNSAADAIAYVYITSDCQLICCACLMVIWEYRAPWQTEHPAGSIVKLKHQYSAEGLSCRHSA